MPNNPGRLGSNEEVTEHEKIRFVDPGSFGSVRKSARPDLRLELHLLFVLLAIIVIALIVAFQLGWI